MAFWLGVAEGIDKQRERELKREIWIGEESSKTREKLLTRRLSAMETIARGRKAEEEELAAHVAVIKAFEKRLESVESPEIRNAYLNILKESPEYAATFLERLVEHEKANEGVYIEGERLIDLHNIIEDTKPDNVSMDDWVDEVSGRVVEMDAGVNHFTSMMGAALNSTDPEELAVLEAEALRGWQPDSTLGIADPDFSETNVSPTDAEAYGRLLFDKATIQFNSDMQSFREKLAAEGLSPAEEETYQRMLAVEGEIIDDPANIVKLPEYVSEAYEHVYVDSPGIANTPWAQYAPRTTSGVSAIPEPEVAEPAQVAPQAMVPPPLEPAPAATPLPIPEVNTPRIMPEDVPQYDQMGNRIN